MCTYILLRRTLPTSIAIFRIRETVKIQIIYIFLYILPLVITIKKQQRQYYCSIIKNKNKNKKALTEYMYSGDVVLVVPRLGYITRTP